MADLGLVAADLVVGLMLGSVFAVIAHGLNVIWGVTKVVNVAHGEFIMLGAYGAYYLNFYLGFNPLLSVPVDAAIGIGSVSFSISDCSIENSGARRRSRARARW